MKRHLLTVCSIIFLFTNSQAQLDSIPNSSFENWLYLPNGVVEPSGWHDNNFSLAAWNVMPDSMANTGFLSAKIDYVSYRGTMYSGFPMAHHPLALDGYMKNFLNLGDTAIISIHVYSSAVLVDSGYAEIYGGIATVFLPFTISITQNASVADSCVITLTGGNMYGSISWYDDLSFSFPTLVEEKSSATDISVFPNPCSDRLFISVIKENSLLTLRDITGKIILEEKLSPLDKVIDMQSLPPGVYLLGIITRKEGDHYLIMKN